MSPKCDPMKIPRKTILVVILLRTGTERAVKRPWTPKEIEVVLEKCQKHAVGSTLPGKTEYMEERERLHKKSKSKNGKL